MTRRLALTLVAFVALLLAMIGMAPFALTIVGVALIVVWIGIPMLIAATHLMRAFVRPWRAWSGWVLDRQILRPYRSFSGGAWFAQLRWIVTDSATWRSLLWILVNATAGFALSLVPVVLLLGSAFYLVYPLLLGVTPPGVFGRPFGFFLLRHWWEGFLLWPVSGLLFGLWWMWTPRLMHGWAALHATFLGPSKTAILAGRVASLSASRADTVDSAAREVRRIERDLHDGVQVRLVSLAMTLGLARELIDTDPRQAKDLVDEANLAASGTLEDLRTLVRGIYPPVLADRGLVGAVRALAIDSPIDTLVRVNGFGSDDQKRLEAPVEACAYFAVAEGLANVIKHAHASRIVIALHSTSETLRVTLHDNGRGGATASPEGGLAGIRRRLGAFDGILKVESPPGGPTQLTMEIPCEPLSLKITPSSAKG